MREQIDGNGVDLISGQIAVSDTPLSMGKSGAGGLELTFYSGYANSLSGDVVSSGSRYTASYGGQTWTFRSTQIANQYLNNEGDGSALRGDTDGNFTLTTNDGTVIYYSMANQQFGTPQITTVSKPTGETITFNYKYINSSGVRLQSVTNNFGYMIKFNYPDASSFVLTSIVAINSAIDYCAPTADTCSGLTVNWPSVSPSGTSFTGPIYSVTLPTPNTGSGTTTYKRASGAVETITYTNGKVSSVTNGVGTWNYAYSQTSGDLATTVTDPQGHTRVVHSSLQTATLAPYVKSDTDGQNNTTTYGHDGAYGRLTSIMTPEGEVTTYTLDNRGNATSTVYTPKPGSGQSAITVTTNYDANCDSPAKCNQPNFVQQTVNGATQQTTYAYNTTTGQVLSVTGTTGANGVAPQTRYSYSPLQALAKTGSGGLGAAGPAISIATSSSACATTGFNGSSCGSSSDEVRTDLGFNTGASTNVCRRPAALRRRPPRTLCGAHLSAAGRSARPPASSPGGGRSRLPPAMAQCRRLGGGLNRSLHRLGRHNRVEALSRVAANYGAGSA